MNPARGKLGIGGSGETDDRGQYRLSLLVPGRYYLLCNTRERQPDPPGRMHRSQPELDYTAIFYPAARDISGATPIDLPPGGEVGGIDLRLQKIRLFHIRGKVAGSSEGSQNTRAGLFMARCEPGERGIIGGTEHDSLDGRNLRRSTRAAGGLLHHCTGEPGFCSPDCHSLRSRPG
jgi:hypothetical protein